MTRALASTAYDTAWVATLPAPEDRARPRFPAAFEWLLDHQLPDGSWGGSLRYEHDRLISTLSALVPLAQFSSGDRARRAIERARRYIWQHGHKLSHEPSELVGFELLLPTLEARVARAGIALPPYLPAYAEERSRKLSLIPPAMLYSPKVTAVHSLEFLGDEAVADKLVAAQGTNGSIGNSPAATAFLVRTVDHAIGGSSAPSAALSYLEHCLAGDGGAAVTVLEPCELFDALWCAYHRFLGGEPGPRVLPPDLADTLEAILRTGAGVSLSSTFPIPDADDTAVAMLLLASCGRVPSYDPLAPFERDGHYASFPYERHPSSGVNIHVLDTLKWLPAAPDRHARMARILSFLADTRVHGVYWFDKWHISPYYATAHAVVALSGLPPEVARTADDLKRAALDWIRETQNEDGSWGAYERPTAEETAYGVLALAHARPFADPHDGSRVDRAKVYLRAHARDEAPPLWIDKCLYLPTHIVAAAIDAALSVS